MQARRKHSVLTYPSTNSQKDGTVSSLKTSRKSVLKTRKMSRLPRLNQASLQQDKRNRRKTKLKRKTKIYNDAKRAQLAAEAVHDHLQSLTKNYFCKDFESLNTDLRSWIGAQSPITSFQAIFSPIHRKASLLMCSERGRVNIFSMQTLKKIGELCVSQDEKSHHFDVDDASREWCFITAETMKEIEYRKQRDAVKLLRKIMIDNARMKEKSKTKKNWKLVKTSIERREILRIFKQHYLYPSLDKQLVDLAIDVMERKRVKPEEILIRQGDKGDHFYICATGTYVMRMRLKEKYSSLTFTLISPFLFPLHLQLPPPLPSLQIRRGA